MTLAGRIDMGAEDHQPVAFDPPLAFSFADVFEMQMAHAADERYTVRDGINVARFAIKLQNLATERTNARESLEISIARVLGEEALRYTPRA